MNDPGVSNVSAHTVRWQGGLEVVRVMRIRRQIVLWLTWQGRRHEVRLGPRVAELSTWPEWRQQTLAENER